MYDVTSGESFANVKRWLHEIDQNCDVVNRILVGNKNDDPDRKVSHTCVFAQMIRNEFSGSFDRGCTKIRRSNGHRII